MGRTGITDFDVEKAALQLQGQGKTPTVDNLHQLLGTGSRTTIATHLKAWKSRQIDGEGKLPAALSTLVTSLWERLQAQADQRVGAIRQASQEECQKHQHLLTQAHQALAELKKQLHVAEECYATASQLNEENTQHIRNSSGGCLNRG